MPTSGMELRIERVRAGLTMTQVSARIGISRQSLWVIERAAVVDPERARQYREAVELLRDATETSGEGAA